MRKVCVTLLAVVLWGCVVFPVLGGAKGPAGPAARPVEAQGATTAAIAAVCLDPAGFVVCAGFILMGLVVYRASGGPMPTGQDLIDAVDNLFGVFEANGPGVQSFRAQYTTHSNYVYLTGQMLFEIAQALATFEALGFVFHEDWHETGVAGYELGTWEGGQITSMTDEFIFPSGENCSMGIGGPGTILRGPDGVAQAWRIGWLESVTEIYTQLDGLPGTDGVYSTLSNNNRSITGWNLACGLMSQTGRLVVTSPLTGGWPSSDQQVSLAQTQFWGIKLMVDGTDPAISFNFNELTLTQALTLADFVDHYYNTPISSTFVDTWDGVSDILLADGTYGQAITAEYPMPGEASWWEGLFGGLGGKLTGIWDALRDIWGVVTDIAGDVAGLVTQVGALPTAMITAISAAVVPSESVTDRVDTVRTTMAGKAPFAWPVVIFSMVGSLFEGGSECPVVNFGTEYAGDWGPTEVEFCLPAGAQTILHTLTQVAAAAMVMIWGFWVYRRLVGS